MTSILNIQRLQNKRFMMPFTITEARNLAADRGDASIRSMSETQEDSHAMRRREINTKRRGKALSDRKPIKKQNAVT